MTRQTMPIALVGPFVFHQRESFASICGLAEARQCVELGGRFDALWLRGTLRAHLRTELAVEARLMTETKNKLPYLDILAGGAS